MTKMSFVYPKSFCLTCNSCYQVNKIVIKLEPTSTRVTRRKKVRLMPPSLSIHHHHSICPLLSATPLASKAFVTLSSCGFDGSDNLQEVNGVHPGIVFVAVFLAKFIAFWQWMLRKLRKYLNNENTWLSLERAFQNGFRGALEVSFRSNDTFMEVLNSIKGWSTMVSQFYVYSGDEDKILEICQEIFDMMKADPNVYVYEEPPRCYPSYVYSDLTVLTVKCNVIYPTKSINPKQDIVEKARTIIEKHGVMPPN